MVRAYNNLCELLMSDPSVSSASGITMISGSVSWPFMTSILNDNKREPAQLLALANKVKKIIAQDKPVTNTQADQVQLYWSLAWEAQELVDIEEVKDNTYLDSGPYWLYVPPSISVDVINENPGINFWCREVYASGVSFLVPRLKRDAKLDTIYLINLWPVIASSAQRDYEKIKNTIIPYSFLDKLPVGLKLDSKLIEEVINGNT